MTVNNEVDDDIVDDIKPDSEEEAIPYQYDITSYGMDFPVDGLVNRIERGDVFVPPFQRGLVWKLHQASRFVESLLLGLPVPGIFLYQEEVTNRMMVVDGQQRLESMRGFYNGKFGGRNFALTGIGVESRFRGKTYDSLNTADRIRLDNSAIHATIIKQDKPTNDHSSAFMVFERLNTGGMPLQPQEIRVAMFHGPFNDLLGKLNENIHWRDMFGEVHPRMKDQEFILRFLAMHFTGRDKYRGPLKVFLNGYMAENRQMKAQSEKDIRCAFEGTMENAHALLGANAFKPPQSNGRFNAAVFDSVAIGIASRLENGNIQDADKLKARYDSLLKDAGYLEATFSGTAHATAVKRRLGLAIDAFSDVA